MKKIAFIIVIMVIAFFISEVSFAGWVNGYYRKDGTYVPGHYRSNPDGEKWNNYGPSQSPSQLYNPSSRDYDGDGISNMYDYDDDNDGYSDDYDSSQYGYDE